VRTDGSYLSASDVRAHFGLGSSPDVSAVVVRWPDGERERWTTVRGDRLVTLRRGSGQREYLRVQHNESQQQRPTRRTAPKALGAAAAPPWLSDAALLAFARIQETSAAPQPKALTAPQFKTLEALVEMIIPADDRSPGAKEARVADYIDLALTESEPDHVLQ